MDISGINPKNAMGGYNRISIQQTEIKITGLGANTLQGLDQVSIGAGAISMKSTQVILERAYASLESNIAAGQEAFEAAGKSDYLTSVANATDNSPEAVSDRMFKGITGYIFGAFANTHPDFNAEEFGDFKGQVMKGLQEGVEDAREIINALSKLTPEADNTIDQTLELLYSKLDGFFTETENSFSKTAETDA